MRVGILAHGFMEWGGGIDFLRNFVASLMQADADIQLYLLAPVKGPRLLLHRKLSWWYRSVKSLGRAERAARYPVSHLKELVTGSSGRLSMHEIDIGPGALESAARRLSLDVIAPSFLPLSSRFPIPWVGYIYDFQHQYYPQLFTKADIRSRNVTFAKMLAQASAVVVNARTVAADIGRYHPQSAARVFALPFNAAPKQGWLDASHDMEPEAFGISRPYFAICNQFWKHKDHGTAFTAFAQFAGAHPGIDLVCTGTAQDYRDPSYVVTLRQQLAREHLTDRVHILGAIPKASQISLLKRSIALIQPTLFEGGPGGGAVFDALSLGVRCLVSDISTNRELDDPLVSFFPTGNAESLHQLMVHAVQSSRPVFDNNELIAAGQHRLAVCGTEVIKALNFVISKQKL